MGKNNTPKFTVEFGQTFLLYYTDRFSTATVSKIDDFIDYVEINGLQGWKGKVAPSDRVPLSYPHRQMLIDKARRYNLWHAHIGDPEFKPSINPNYQVSEWVIHFQKFSNDHIKLLELDSHNPMSLPSAALLDEKPLEEILAVAKP
jgi:hypothetical protein